MTTTPPGPAVYDAWMQERQDRYRRIDRAVDATHAAAADLTRVEAAAAQTISAARAAYHHQIVTVRQLIGGRQDTLDVLGITNHTLRTAMAAAVVTADPVAGADGLVGCLGRDAEDRR